MLFLFMATMALLVATERLRTLNEKTVEQILEMEDNLTSVQEAAVLRDLER